MVIDGRNSNITTTRGKWPGLMICRWREIHLVHGNRVHVSAKHCATPMEYATIFVPVIRKIRIIWCHDHFVFPNVREQIYFYIYPNAFKQNLDEFSE